MTLHKHLAMGLLTGLLAAPAVTLAQAFPDRPVKMVVAFAPGGPTDVLARVVATGLAKTLGQPVVVDNRTGAGGMLGTREVAKASADGYTLLFAGDAALTVLPQLSKSAGYDPVKDFTPLRVVASQANVLLVNTSKGITDVPGLIQRAKAAPRTVTFASAGNGSPSHLIGALFESQAGIDMVHVPYRGAGPAMTDLLGGQVDALFVGTPTALQHASRKELLALATTGDKRLPGLPAVPTFAETGIRQLGAETAIWWSLMGPAALPAEVSAKLDLAIRNTLDDTEVRRQLERLGVDVLNLDARKTTEWITRDHAKWGALIAAKKITTE